MGSGARVSGTGRWLVLAALVVGVGGAAVLALDLRFDDAGLDDAQDVARSATGGGQSLEPAGQPTLQGAAGSTADASGSGAHTDVVSGTDVASPDAVPPVSGAGPLAPPGAVLGSLFPLAPGAVEDLVAPGALLPIRLERSDLVGRVLPYGERDDPGAGAVRWIGVASLERADRADSEAPDDTADPLTTAVRGVVVGEDGQPIRDAEVILYSSFYLRQVFYDHRVRQIGRVFTAPDGTFDLRPLDLDTVHFGADGEVLVTVRHPHYADLVAQPLPGIAPGRESDVGRLVLPAQGVTLRGVVLDLGEKPVAGAVVRASGVMNPVAYDKTERMVVLNACPAATTDEQGRYELSDFAAGVHEISVTIRIDCVLHVRERWEGFREWSPRVRAGNAVRGRVVAPDGTPVAAAVVLGGGNWTPTNADGTFWLDNVFAGPLTLEVAHHAWHTVYVPGVATNAEEVVLAFERPLARVTLLVVDAMERPVPLVALDWAWPAGSGPGRYAPASRYWSDPGGRYAVTVPEGAVGATVSDTAGAAAPLAPEDLLDGTSKQVVLLPPAPGR